MNYISFIYFGSESDFHSPFLKDLNVVKFEPPRDGYFGLYASESKYGRKELHKISLNLKEMAPDTGWLIYRYLSDEEYEILKNETGLKKIYIILSNYLNNEYLIDLVDANGYGDTAILEENVEPYDE